MLLRVALYDNLFACLENNRLVARGGADLRALGVDKDGDLVRYLTGVLDNSTDALVIHVGSVATDNVHTGLMEFADELYVATNIRNRSDDFGKFLLHLLYYN